ncbi:MAG TPA: hypothetical protein PL087_10390, partial [Bacteroidales bacterium]|nr:hypothetical protein [Bacteroidales bacterium]
MKKITLLLNRFVLVFLLGLASMTAMAQLSGPKTDAIVTLQPDLTGLCHGATVHVPIYITANNVLGMDFYIEFDHTVLTRAEDSVANVYPGFNVVYNYVYHPLYPNVLYLGLNNPSFIGTNFTGQKLIDLVFIYNGEGSATSTPIHLRTAGDVIPPPTCVLFDADGGVIPAQYISNTVSGFPLPTATLSGGGTICAGASVDLNVAFTGTAPWTITYTDGTTPVTVSGITANPYTLTVTPEATATYTISNVTDGNLCSNVGTGSAAILVNPLPTATISGGTAICPGGSATISVDLTGTAPWNFTYFDGTAYTPVTGVMTTPYTFLVAPTATTTYTITEVTDANLCMNTGTGSAEIIVNALPTAEISGTTGICPGGSATLSIALTGAQPWDFTYTDGTTPVTITGNILNPYTFDVNPIVNTTYNVLTVTDGNLCTNTGTGSATVSINAVPTATIAGSQTICYGEEATLSVVLTGTAPWGFTYTDGTTEVSITGVNDPLYTFNVAPTTTSTFTITQVVDGNLCTNTGTGDAFVWVNPLPVVAFEGTYGPYNLTDPAVTLVATPAGGTFSGNGVSGDQFTPAVAGGGWHVITYTYTDGNGCTNSTNISITVYAGTVTLQPDLTGLCGGETILVPIYLTGNNIAGMDFYIEYDHSVLSMGTPPGWTNLYPGFSATYNYVYNPAYPNLSFLSLNNPSMIGVDFTGQKIIDLVFTYNGGTTPIHLRTLPDVTPPPLCALYDDNGSELAPTSYIDNMVDGSPALMVGDIADNQTICAGEIPALLTSTGPLNGTDPTYQWQVSGDGINFTNIDGAIGTDYQPAALNITTFYRQLQDADATCGGPLPTNSITIVVNPLPMGTISGSQTICAGSSATLTVDLTGTAPWEITYTDGTTPVVVPGILDTPYLFDVTPGMTTNYTLLNVTDVNLCSTTGTGNALVEVTPLPMATISGSQTICTGSEATLAVDFSGTSPWEITITDGTTPIVVPGITENPYMFEVNPVETTTYSILNVTDATLCSNTGTGEALVEVFPLPMATISGSQTICAGSSATLAVDLTGTAPWEITYTDGTTPVVVPGILDTPYLFDVTPGITTTYTLVNVTDGNLCSNVGTGEALV